MNAKEFLDTIFEEADDDEFICVSRSSPKKDAEGVWFASFKQDARQFRKWNPDEHAQAWYFCVSSVNGELNDRESSIGRGRRHLKRYHCLVLDDIGTKGTPPPVEPSWKIETSEGNEQWGYMLNAGDDFERYEQLVEHCHQQGWGDAGAGGSYRLMRVPGSANLKEGRDNFRSVIKHWDALVWTLDELAEDLDFTFTKEDTYGKTEETETTAPPKEGIDPLFDWLLENGHVHNDDGATWVSIVCPWADRHTTGENTAGYSPLGRGTGVYTQTRAFNCMHEHCKDKKITKFREWASKQGAPAVSGYDPLPWLQERYVYVETGQRVFDLIQRPVGGRWQWEFPDFVKKHVGRIFVAGRENPVLISTAFIEDENTKRVVDTMYRPVSRDNDTGIITAFKQSYVNTYHAANWDETEDTPSVFLEHMDYLLPCKDERNLFLNWLAYKIQHPDSRSYAIVMVAEDAQGTGRSWLKDMIENMLQGGVNTATMPQLYGKGTSAEQTYNDWKSECQFICVEESKNNDMSREDYYNGYETFKLNVDTKVTKSVRINPKFGRTRHEDLYYNVLIFSNHADAMAIKEEDRRICVLENPSQRLDYDYYDRLVYSLQSDEPRRLFWWLMRRDLKNYDHIYPPMTPAKQRMIFNTRSPSDSIFEWIQDNFTPDLVTRATLRGAVVLAARELDDEKNLREPSLMAKILWKKMRTLRPDDPKNGARYVIDGKQNEVRAVRNYELWLKRDKVRDPNIVSAELEKTENVSNVVKIAR